MRLLITLLFLTLSCAPPLSAQDTTGTIATDNTAQQDADIAIRIREILEELGNYSDVTVTVSEGIVTLRGTTNSAVEATELTPLSNRIQGVVAVKNQVTETTEIGRRLDPALERFRARIDQVIIFLPLAMIALAAFIVVVLIGFRLASARQPWERLAPNAFIAELYRTFVRLAFVIGAVVISLDIMNATALLSTILGAAGIIGLAIGFAVRDTVENFIASVMLSIRQPFRPNDTVEINGDIGKVIRLTSRATILLSFDGNHIRIPNATVFKSRIINYSQNAERRFQFTVLIDRDCEMQKARSLAEETVQSLPFTLHEPRAQSWIDAIDTASITLVITGWIDQNESSMALSKGEAIRQVKHALEAAGIGLTDSAQAIVIDPGAPLSKPQETSIVAAVTSSSDSALEKIIAAERHDEASQDLLREGAEKE